MLKCTLIKTEKFKCKLNSSINRLTKDRDLIETENKSSELDLDKFTGNSIGSATMADAHIRTLTWR